jgi:hypothetical protein
MKKNKKAGITNLIGWILFLLAGVLLYLMYQNDMNFSKTVGYIVTLF